MNCSVNLVPECRMQARARRRRRNTWITLVSLLTLLAGTAWGVQWGAAGSAQRLSDRIIEIKFEQQRVAQRLIAAAGERDRLLAGLERVALARRPQPWAPRLVQLTEVAPENVFLTALHIVPTEKNAGRGRTPARESEADAQATLEELTSDKRAVRVLGYALDHDGLIRLIGALQDSPGWERVDLVRATVEQRARAQIVAFELDCLTREDLQ